MSFYSEFFYYCITTLFNLFCPLFNSRMLVSTLFLLLSVVGFSLLTLETMLVKRPANLLKGVPISLFPSIRGLAISLVSAFLLIILANLLSLICYRYPLTTTLGFNLSIALTLWLISVLFVLIKSRSLSRLLPSNSPRYLIPFLCLVEFVRVIVRPVTLCFRLLANMSAGHILLSLICKIGIGLWTLGVLLGVLELIVSVVQAFVFTMLVTVYLEEAITH